MPQDVVGWQGVHARLPGRGLTQPKKRPPARSKKRKPTRGANIDSEVLSNFIGTTFKLAQSNMQVSTSAIEALKDQTAAKKKSAAENKRDEAIALAEARAAEKGTGPYALFWLGQSVRGVVKGFGTIWKLVGSLTKSGDRDRN